MRKQPHPDILALTHVHDDNVEGAFQIGLKVPGQGIFTRDDSVRPGTAEFQSLMVEFGGTQTSAVGYWYPESEMVEPVEAELMIYAQRNRKEKLLGLGRTAVVERIHPLG